MKKSREEISKSILKVLEKCPLSIQQISKEVGSNWITISEVLQELKNKGEVREIISTEKIKLYQKIIGDTYYNIPITEEQREEFRYVFSLAIEEYKRIKKRLPNKTELAKAVVDTIRQAKLNLPVVWYIYGQIPLMISDPLRDYFTQFTPKNNKKIREIISKTISCQKHKNVRELKLGHYNKYNNLLYELKEKFFSSANYSDWDKHKNRILDFFNSLLINCPIASDYPEIFSLTERITAVVNKMALQNSINKHKIEIILATDCLWKFISTYLLFDSLSGIPEYSNRKELLQFYIGHSLEMRKYSCEEVISNLESIYLSELTEKEQELEGEAIKVREILSDWPGG